MMFDNNIFNLYSLSFFLAVAVAVAVVVVAVAATDQPFVVPTYSSCHLHLAAELSSGTKY